MNKHKFKTTRNITKAECPWIDKDVQAGTTVYQYFGPKYGCTGNGIAVTLKEGKEPFFEVPKDAVVPYHPYMD